MQDSKSVKTGKAGYILAFIIAFLPRLFWSLQSIPVRTISDEISTMNVAVFWIRDEHIVCPAYEINFRSGNTLSGALDLYGNFRMSGGSYLFLPPEKSIFGRR